MLVCKGKIIMDYKNLEQEIKERKDNLTSQSWRGDLSKRGLDNVSWGIDLKKIEQESLDIFKYLC